MPNFKGKHVKLLSVLTFVVAVCFWFSASSPAGPASKPSSAPAVLDLVAELEEAEDGAARERFFATAGVTGEIGPDKFSAGMKKVGEFIRPYDQWAVAKLHDADGSGTLNWAEALDYRQALAKQILKKFDKDGDGKLTGKEREEANAFLAGGVVIPIKVVLLALAGEPFSRPTSHPAASRPALDPGVKDFWQKMAEKEAAQKALLAKYDLNRNGKLDPEELKAIADDNARRSEQAKRLWELDRYDLNHDGVLDEKELARKKEIETAEAEKQKQEYMAFIARWDKDGDGKLSEEENAAMIADFHAAAARLLKAMDTDGNGKVSPEEEKAFKEKMLKKYDKNQNGKLDLDEIRAMNEGEGELIVLPPIQPPKTRP